MRRKSAGTLLASVALATLISAASEASAASAASAANGITLGNRDLFQKSLEATRQALVQYGPLDRPAEMRRLAEIGYRIVAEAKILAPPVSFYLLDMPEPNAFALPGGQVVVTRGMIDLGLTDDQLAALLGHEIAHVVLLHGVKMERRATLLNILSQAALIGVILQADRGNRAPDAYGYGLDVPQSSRAGDLIQGTAAAGLVLTELLLRSYSREFEDQADEEGQRWAAGAGFDPDGARQLFDVMGRRLPQDRKYGYWQTHPFFDSRVSAALARGQMLKIQPQRSATALRQETQEVLLAYAEELARQPAAAKERDKVAQRVEQGPRALPPLDLDLKQILKRTALAAWPSGTAAENLRAERLRREREREMERLPLGRDYGKLLRQWDREIDEVRAVSPESGYLDQLARERRELAADAQALYAKAVEVLEGGVYETAFLEAFESNYPDAKEKAKVALALGDAYSRLDRPADAVPRFLAAWRADSGGPLGVSARAGLRSLTAVLRDLTALQELAEQNDDPELQGLAIQRLESMVSAYTDLASGAAYLRRYPQSPHAEKVGQRLAALADNLYGEMVLYQSVGDHVKALDRIQQILTHAPSSPAAERLRDKATVAG